MSDQRAMGGLAAQDAYDDTQLMPYGVGSPAESAGAPSGLGALASGAYEYLGGLAKRAFGASEQMRQGGSYNPAPIVEAAMLPMTGAVAGTGPGGFAVGAGPIKAYHSSPHDFDKFDLAKIGTGEGAQVYGHGLYFAENPAVSGQGGQYWKAFSERFREGGEGKAVQYLKSEGMDRAAAARAIEEEIEATRQSIARGENYKSADSNEKYLRDMDYARALLQSDKPVGPRTYEVNINADPAHMLDWDKRFTPEGLEQFASKLDAVSPSTRNMLEDWSYRNQQRGMPLPAGEDVFRELKALQNPKQFSSMLNEAGIPGIKYLDQGSRNAPISSMGIKQLEGRLEQYKADLAGGFGDPERMRYNIASIERELASYKPSHNYVVFDPSIIDIMKKYGIAGAAPAGIGALAAQDAYQTEERM